VNFTDQLVGGNGLERRAAFAQPDRIRAVRVDLDFDRRGRNLIGLAYRSIQV